MVDWSLLCPGLVLIAFGVGLIIRVRRIFDRRIELFVYGFQYWKGGEVDNVAWTEVSLIRKTIVHERIIKSGVISVLLPSHKSVCYTILADWGREYKFDGDAVRKIKEFGAILNTVASRFSLPWEDDEVQR